MVGKGLTKRLPRVRGRVVRLGSAVAALLAVTVVAAGCETPPPRYEGEPLSFADRPPLVFDLDRIEVVERPVAPGPGDVGHLFPTPPDVAIGLWVRDRLRARGTTGALRVTVEEASVRSTPLETDADLEGLFTKEEEERLDLRLRVTIEAIDMSGQVNGSATADASRSRTLLEGITLVERERIYDQAIRDLLHDLDTNLEGAIRQYLHLYLR